MPENTPELRHGRTLNIPSERTQAVLWLVQRLTKLINERLNTAQCIKDAKRAAINDGYSNEVLAAAYKLKKMSPERREQYRERLAKAFSLYGLTVEVLAEDPKLDNLLMSHLQKIQELSRDRSDISEEITETYKAAKDYGIDIVALREILKLSRLDEDERSERFARIDNLGAILNYW